jgi:hypothetical protein
VAAGPPPALTAVISTYNGSAALTVLKAWQMSIAAHLADVSLTFSDGTMAGQHASCAHWSHGGDQANCCVATDGILANVQASGGSSDGEGFQLASYTATAQNAALVTILTGASAP